MKLLEANGAKVIEAAEVETKPQPEVRTWTSSRAYRRCWGSIP